MIARTKAGIAAARAAVTPPVVLVPTMGALHAGHRALLRAARRMAGPGGTVVVSVFVNPLQFGPAEDFDRYPRDLRRDVAVCEEEGAAVVFAPRADQMYPGGHQTVTVSAGQLGQLLEGRSRPGFFDGVLTVVVKLFHLTQPDAAVFGEKDAQQLALVRRMAAELDAGVGICAVPIVREPDGLAASSRNAYLSAEQRAVALALPQALRAGAAQACRGAAAVISGARAVLDNSARGGGLVTDYLALVDPVTFADVGSDYTGPALLLAAVYCGSVRLIDNVALTIGAGTECHAADD
jgi:pantoate--beta-alanine ligase